MVRPVIQSKRTGINEDYKQAFVNVYDSTKHILRNTLINDDGEIGTTNPLPITITDPTTGDKAEINSTGQLKVVLDGKVDLNNSSSETLIGDEFFQGSATDTLDYAIIFITVFSDVASATNGLTTELSSDGITWRDGDNYTIPADTEKTFSIQTNKQYFRIKYTNGTSPQGIFDLQTVFKKTNSKSSSHKIDDDVSGEDDTELVTAILKSQTNDGKDYENISVQNPLPTNGDSIYVKDLDIANCNNGNFSGSVSDYFDSLKTVNNDSTSNNPKTIMFWFKRTIYASSIGFGCDDLTKSFSNIKIKFLGSGEVIRKTIDLSTDNTKYNSKLVEFEPIAFNGVILEFHTVDEIGLSNITIPKEVQTAARIKGQTPGGETEDVQVTEDGYLTISDSSNGLAIAKGEVTGHTTMSKFGQNDNLNTSTYEDIWDVGGTYPYPADGTAPITHIDSDNAVDTEPTEVQGLDINGDLVIQTKTLTGTTPIALDTPLWRVFRMRNIGTSDFVGKVQAINAADTVIYAQIQNGNNQTLMALFTIPNGKTGYLMQGTNSVIGLVRNYSIAGKLWMRQYGSVFQLKKTFGLSSDGTSYMVMPFPFPVIIPAKTDIRVSAISSATGGGINTTFEVVLVDD